MYQSAAIQSSLESLDDTRTYECLAAGNGRAMQERCNRDRGGRLKVFLYSHDTFGLGHLRRNLAIATCLLRRPEKFSVHLITGSPVIAQWRLPYGLHVQPLPPVVKTGVESYSAREAGRTFGLVKGYREALILKLLLRHQPDIFLVDHAPAGMNGELLSTLALIRREFPWIRTMLGLRDILDSPENVQAIWRAQDIHALIEEAYDDVLVYGSESLFDVVDSYALPENIARRVRYCGHVVEAPNSDHGHGRRGTAQVCWSPARVRGRPVVLVTAGGGGDGHFLMDAYLRSLDMLPSAAPYSAIVMGPLMEDAEKAALRAMAAKRADVELIDHTVNLVPSLQAADLVVAMAGYNTSAEIIANRKRAILVPRAAPRAEQRLRASLLAGLGVVRCVEPGPDLAQRLAAALPAAMAAPAPAPALWARLFMNGAERVSEYLQTVVPMFAQSLA
jgi:predicted glycosyltransferase